MDHLKQSPRLGPVVVKLLQGVLYRDQHEAVWQDLLALQAPVMDYIRVIGLDLVMDEAEGYAYLKQNQAPPDDGALPVPRLLRRRPLGYPVSLLCVLLRKKLVEADAGGEGLQVVITREQIVEMLRMFLPQQSNEAKLVDKIGAHINKVIELGFLRKLKKEPGSFEIRRILKALVDADWLADLDEKMAVYRKHLSGD